MKARRIVTLLIALMLLVGAVAPAAMATTISLNKTSYKYSIVNKVKEKITLKATVSNGGVKWSTSNKSVASIKASGTKCTVTLKKAGTATITAKATDGSGAKATCKITVKKVSATTYYNKKLKPNMDDIGDYLGSYLSSQDDMKRAFENAKVAAKKLKTAANKFPGIKYDATAQKYLVKLRENIQEGQKRAEKVASSDSQIMTYQQNAMKYMKKFKNRARKMLNLD